MRKPLIRLGIIPRASNIPSVLCPNDHQILSMYHLESGINDSSHDFTEPTCPTGLCINPATHITYMFSDACKPEQFNKAGCENCSEKIECQFTRLDMIKSFLHTYIKKSKKSRTWPMD